MSNEHDRRARGLQKLAELDSEAAAALTESLRDVAPDLGRYAIEFAFGDVFARPGLDLRTREVANVAALTALGNARPQLKFHINAALNAGVTRDEIGELVIQMAVYAGFPAALNAASAAAEVFAERDRS